MAAIHQTAEEPTDDTQRFRGDGRRRPIDRLRAVAAALDRLRRAEAVAADAVTRRWAVIAAATEHHPVAEIARVMRVDRQTVYRAAERGRRDVPSVAGATADDCAAADWACGLARREMWAAAADARRLGAAINDIAVVAGYSPSTVRAHLRAGMEVP